MKRQTIEYILKYSGLGLLLAVAVYLINNSFDYKALGILILAVGFFASSFFWK